MTSPPGPPGQKKGKPVEWIPERPKKRGAAPASLAEVLIGAQEYSAQRSGVAIPRAEWSAIVGPRIASRTRVGALKAGVLTVKVASSSWSNELSFLKADLLSKLNRAGHDVSDLRFYVDKIETDPRDVARGRLIPQAPMMTALPPELLKRLEKVEDENLRAAIAEAARRSLRAKP